MPDLSKFSVYFLAANKWCDNIDIITKCIQKFEKTTFVKSLKYDDLKDKDIVVLKSFRNEEFEMAENSNAVILAPNILDKVLSGAIKLEEIQSPVFSTELKGLTFTIDPSIKLTPFLKKHIGYLFGECTDDTSNPSSINYCVGNEDIPFVNKLPIQMLDFGFIYDLWSAVHWNKDHPDILDYLVDKLSETMDTDLDGQCIDSTENEDDGSVDQDKDESASAPKVPFKFDQMSVEELLANREAIEKALMKTFKRCSTPSKMDD